jgi:hypothetical protein
MKRSYRYNEETQQMEEITREPREVIHGTVWGREMLDRFRREGLCPMSDFKDTWAKADIERKRIRGELPPTPQMREERRQKISEAIDKVRAGYRPNRRPMLED